MSYILQPLGGLLISSFEERDIIEVFISFLDAHDGVCPHVLVFDLPYKQGSEMNIAMVEKLLNGYVSSEKYRGKQLALPKFHVVVFSNCAPDTTQLTWDRWSFQLNGNTHSSIVDLTQHEATVDAAFCTPVGDAAASAGDGDLCNFLAEVVKDDALAPVQMPGSAGDTPALGAAVDVDASPEPAPFPSPDRAPTPSPSTTSGKRGRSATPVSPVPTAVDTRMAPASGLVGDDDPNATTWHSDGRQDASEDKGARAFEQLRGDAEFMAAAFK